MKMTLKRANWACLLTFVLIFAACKKEKEEEVVPEPIVGVTVENGDADVTIDQQEKRIDVTFYAYCDLSEVLVSFDLIEGAQMFIPYLKDTVYMDLSKEKGATVAARVDGQTVVYTMFATIEYALAGVQVKAEDVDGEVTLYREDRVVRVVFDRPVDLSRVDVTFLLGASGTLVDPQSNPVTMDLTEPARFTVASERARGDRLYDRGRNRYGVRRSRRVDGGQGLRIAVLHASLSGRRSVGGRGLCSGGRYECRVYGDRRRRHAAGYDARVLRAGTLPPSL